MLENVYHLLGICSDHSHPSLLGILVGEVGSSPFFSYIYWRIKILF